MDEEVYKLVLNGLPFREFIVFYLFSVGGAVAFFLYSLYKAIKMDINTPFTFSMKHLYKGLIRVFLTIIVLAISIIYWDQISMFIFAVEDPVELNGWSSFLLGTLTDRLLEVVLGGGADAGKYVKKRIKNGS